MHTPNLILIGPMMLIALLKLVLPGKALRTACSRGVMWVAETWAEIDKLIFATLTPHGVGYPRWRGPAP